MTYYGEKLKEYNKNYHLLRTGKRFRQEYISGQRVKIIWEKSKYFNKVGIISRRGHCSLYWVKFDDKEIVMRYNYMEPIND